MPRDHRSAKRRHRRVATAVVAVIVSACSGGGASAPTTTTAGPSTTQPGGSPRAGLRATSDTLALRLSQGHSQAAPAEPVKVVNGEPLDQAAIDAIIARLPDWSGSEVLQQPFNWPTQTLNRPRTGQTIDAQFPPPGAVDKVVVPTGPLEVLRFQPEGKVTIAPFISVTFNQPMVPVGTVGQLDNANVPATITPALPGHWQWIGTRTLRFDHTSDLIDRLPMATDYTVTIPAGTKSATGGELAAAVTWQFSTPPITVQSLQPTGESLPLTPVFVAAFDQRIDPAAVLATVTLRAGDTPQPLRLATADEIAADAAARQTTSASPEGRWLAFRPQNPLPADVALTIDIGPQTPSAEGTLTADTPSTYQGHTYAPLKVTSTACGFGPDCPPPSDINVEFNNALDAKVFDPATVRIEPAVPGAVVSAYANVINIRGNTLGRTKYTVTIPKGLTDVFGQTLADDAVETITIGSAAPMLLPFPQPFITLDPLAAKQEVTILTVNHASLHFNAFAVEPKDWPEFQAYLLTRNQGSENERALPRWPVLIDTTVATNGEPDRQTETHIDLTAALAGHHTVVVVAPTEQYSPNSNDYYSNRPTVAWVQSTSIGVDAFADSTTLQTWTTDLKTGAPMSDVTIQSLGSTGNATTDAKGLASLALTSTAMTSLVATKGDDSALLPAGYYGESWQEQPRDDEARWFVFDDRQTYRPGETVSMKGWVRRFTTAGDAQLKLLDSGAKVSYTVSDAQGNALASGTADVNALGGFDLSFTIAAGANLGPAYVSLTLEGVTGMPFAQFAHPFQIEEFRRPEFEVVARHESTGPFVSAKPATVAVDANYYAGGPLGAAPVTWTVSTTSATYAPPGWDTFNFGVWTPWWFEGDFGGPGFAGGRGFVGDGGFAGDTVPCCFGPGQSPDVQTFAGTTDAGGTHFLQIDFGGPKGEAPDLPVTVSAQATVTDVNRQAWSSTTSVLVHPGELYVGLRSDRTFVRQGDPMKIEAIVTDTDGKAVAGRAVKVTASRLEWTFKNGEWKETPTDGQTCDVTSAATAASCTFTTSVGGTYTITSTIVDDNGGQSRSELTRWVSGGDSKPSRNVEQQTVNVVPDKAEYAPGDSAQLLVQSPFTPGEGLATVTRDGIVSTTRFQIVDGSAVVAVPVAEGDIPNLNVNIEVVGTAERTADDGTALPDAPKRPAYAVGNLTLPISLASRTLAVTATPRDPAVAPGASTKIDVSVKDHAGAPVAGAEFAVVVVDEAVLALSNYQLQDPLGAFYSQIYPTLNAKYGRESIILADPASVLAPQGGGATRDEATAATTAAPAAGEAPSRAIGPSNTKSAPALADATGYAGAAAPTAPAIDVRTDFDALAVFQPSVTTAADGTATVDVTLPDNLTRYRVMVVAVNGAEQFGKAEANITARLPLMIRPSAPRFLNFGDAIELPVVAQNQSDQAMVVDIALQTANLDITGPAGVRVNVPANDRVEVRFPVTAAQAGTARFRVGAVSGDAADAATIELPVYTPATAEAFATYGVIDDGATIQPVLAPTTVIPQFGSLDVTTSSTSLQALTDAVLYIVDYRYESSDGLASQILAIAALRQVLDAFDAAGLPSPKALDAAVATYIDKLLALQNDDGGFSYWVRNVGLEPYNSIQATHALVVAKANGYPVPQVKLDAGLAYIAEIEQHTPPEWGTAARDALSAYALYVRHLAGTGDSAKANDLYARSGATLQLDALAWLWPSIDDPAAHAAIGKVFQNRAVETAGAANFATTYGDAANLILQSDRRTDGVILEALISEQPDSDLIPKVVTGLLAEKVAGRWDNIQENSFILLALKQYFDTYEQQTPDFVARVWLGDRFAGDHTFTGRTTDRARVAIPTADLITAGNTDLTLSKDGAGRLYYRIGLRYAPESLRLDPLDRGFVVGRTYEGVDNPADVTRDPDGTWQIKAGAKVRVRLTMVAESQRTRVALIDPLPAGLEIVNPSLATTADLPPDTQPTDSSNYYWYRTWFDHQNVRDDGAEAFSSLLPAGTYDYSYVARATTPGTFVTPPTRAEEIYAPETFGRGATDSVVIG